MAMISAALLLAATLTCEESFYNQITGETTTERPDAPYVMRVLNVVEYAEDGTVLRAHLLTTEGDLDPDYLATVYALLCAVPVEAPQRASETPSGPAWYGGDPRLENRR